MHLSTLLLGSLLFLSNLATSQNTITITRTIGTVIITEPPTSISTISTKTTTKKPLSSSSSIKPPTTIKTSTKATTTSPNAPVTETIYTTVTVTAIPTSKPVQTTKSSTATAKPTLTAAPDPNTTKCPVPLYYQCGGSRSYNGCTKCVAGADCVSQNEFYWQCVNTATDW